MVKLRKALSQTLDNLLKKRREAFQTNFSAVLQTLYSNFPLCVIRRLLFLFKNSGIENELFLFGLSLA